VKGCSIYFEDRTAF